MHAMAVILYLGTPDVAYAASSSPLAPDQPTVTVAEVPRETTEQMIRRLSSEAGLDPDTMLAIARAESWDGTKLDPMADNPTSTADGIFQIIDGTWAAFRCEGVKKNAYDNVRCAVKIASTSGLHHWDASAHNW